MLCCAGQGIHSMQSLADREGTPLQACGFRVLVTQLTPTSVPIHDIDFTRPTAFILGNEVNGKCRMSERHLPEISEHKSLSATASCTAV